jgi:type IV pilus assembly protein PilW
MKTVLNHKGFTLAEMAIALAISSIAMTLIYATFNTQRLAFTTQQQTAVMQQNIRSAMSFVETEIRMAGFEGFDTATMMPRNTGTGIIAANAATFVFSADFDDNGSLDAGDTITYTLSGNTLTRNSEIMAYDIEAVGFAYAFEDSADADNDLELSNGEIIWAIDQDGDGVLDRSLDTSGDGVVDISDSAAGTDLNTMIDDDGDSLGNISIDRIRTVRIWILARTRAPIKGYADTSSYKVGTQVVFKNDGFRHNLLTSTIKCRNLGLM